LVGPKRRGEHTNVLLADDSERTVCGRHIDALSNVLGNGWEPLARAFKINDEQIAGHKKNMVVSVAAVMGTFFIRKYDSVEPIYNIVKSSRKLFQSCFQC
jgi:hypothetical protein